MRRNGHGTCGLPSGTATPTTQRLSNPRPTPDVVGTPDPRPTPAVVSGARSLFTPVAFFAFLFGDGRAGGYTPAAALADQLGRSTAEDVQGRICAKGYRLRDARTHSYSVSLFFQFPSSSPLTCMPPTLGCSQSMYTKTA